MMMMNEKQNSEKHERVPRVISSRHLRGASRAILFSCLSRPNAQTNRHVNKKSDKVEGNGRALYAAAAAVKKHSRRGRINELEKKKPETHKARRAGRA